MLESFCAVIAGMNLSQQRTHSLKFALGLLEERNVLSSENYFSKQKLTSSAPDLTPRTHISIQYSHLGCAASMSEMRRLLESRSGFYGMEVRIESLLNCSESKSREGCPLAKWIIRRSSNTEKLLALVKYISPAPSSSLGGFFVIVAFVIWDAIDTHLADKLYEVVVYKTTNFGMQTDRRCSLNESRTCACQGVSERTRGSCYSFGCSWSMYNDGCKFGRSRGEKIRKFKLTKRDEEPELECILNELACLIAPMFQVMAPEAYRNHINPGPVANECRIGHGLERPFSGVTACLDFCAHNHRDVHNMDGGATLIVTLKKPPREYQVSHLDDDQLHVLPGYSLQAKDEFGFKQGFDLRVRDGSIQVLDRFSQVKRLRSSPLGSCKQRKEEAITLKRLHKVRKDLFNADVTLSSSPDLLSPTNQVNESSFSSRSKKVVKHRNERNEIIYEVESENEDLLDDVHGSGVALLLPHGSLLIECAKQETHASTALRHPNRLDPQRVSLVFYQHKNLKKPCHGQLDLLIKQYKQEKLNA